MAIFWAKRRGNTLVPLSYASQLEMERMPEGVPLKIDARRQRSGNHHRLVFALFSLTAKALNDGPTPREWTTEDVAHMVKIALGHVKTFKLPPAAAKRYGTEIGMIPASLSYQALDQTEFSQFADRAMRYIATDLCPWLEQSEHWPEIASILAESGLGVAA